MVSKRWWRRRFDASIEHTDEREKTFNDEKKNDPNADFDERHNNRNNSFFPSLSFRLLLNLILLFSSISPIRIFSFHQPQRDKKV